MEPYRGVEPRSSAWKAVVLAVRPVRRGGSPLNRPGTSRASAARDSDFTKEPEVGKQGLEPRPPGPRPGALTLTRHPVERRRSRQLVSAWRVGLLSGYLPLLRTPRGPPRIRTEILLLARELLCQLELAAQGRRDDATAARQGAQGPCPVNAHAMDVSMFKPVREARRDAASRTLIQPVLETGSLAAGSSLWQMKTARWFPCGRLPA